MKNTNDIHIKKLQNKIYTCLDSLIDADYSLIDIPDYNNIGDNLIWEGELDYLSRLNIKNYSNLIAGFLETKIYLLME